MGHCQVACGDVRGMAAPITLTQQEQHLMQSCCERSPTCCALRSDSVRRQLVWISARMVSLAAGLRTSTCGLQPIDDRSRATAPAAAATGKTVSWAGTPRAQTSAQPGSSRPRLPLCMRAKGSCIRRLVKSGASPWRETADGSCGVALAAFFCSPRGACDGNCPLTRRSDTDLEVAVLAPPREAR